MHNDKECPYKFSAEKWAAFQLSDYCKRYGELDIENKRLKELLATVEKDH